MSQSQGRVLIVDDESAIRRALHHTLQGMGFEVEDVATGEAALREPVHLTPKEFDLLRYLMAHAGLPITHARLLHAVWGPEYGGELEYLRTLVRQLRKKLEEAPAEPVYLLTDSHVGYRFAEAKADPVGVTPE